MRKLFDPFNNPHTVGHLQLGLLKRAYGSAAVIVNTAVYFGSGKGVEIFHSCTAT